MKEEKIVLTIPQLYCNYKNIFVRSNSRHLGLHYHAMIEIIYVKKGSILCNIENTTHTIHQNSFLILGSDVVHRLYYNNEDANVAYLQIDLSKLIRLVYKDLPDIPFLLDSSEKKYLLVQSENPKHAFLKRIFEEIVGKKPYFELGLTGDFLKLTSYLQNEGIICDFKALFKDLSVKKIYPVLSYINEHFSENISLDDMCEVLHIDKYYLCKLFKKSTVMTFTKYITRVRIQHAELLLTTTDKSVTDIAFDCGFSTVQYFITVFTKAKGCSPNSFRQSDFKTVQDILSI